MDAEILRGVYPERSEWAQDDSQDPRSRPLTGSLLSKRLQAYYAA